MDIDNRYWSGLFDGEGNICFSRDLRRCQVRVTQKEMPILFLLKKQFGGAIYTHHKGNPYVCHHWNISNAKIIKQFLLAIQPYCLIKGTEIRIALELLSGFYEGHTGGKGKKIDPLELERRKNLKNMFMDERADMKQREFDEVNKN